MTRLTDLTLILNLINILIGKCEWFAGYGETGPPTAWRNQTLHLKIKQTKENSFFPCRYKW